MFEASLARWKNQGWKAKEETNLSDVGGKGGDKGVGEAHGGCGGLDGISLWKAEYSDAPNKVIVDPVRVKIPIAPWLCLTRVSASSCLS